MTSLRLLAVALAAVLLATFAAPATALESELADRIKTELDNAEKVMERKLLPATILLDIRQKIDPLEEKLREALDEVDPKLQAAKTRLEQLGPKPADGQPPESAEAKAQRDALTKEVGDIDTKIKQIKVLQVRIDQMQDRVNERRRELVTAQLFERTESAFDPRFWVKVGPSLPRAWNSLHILVTDWTYFITNMVGYGALIGGLAMMLIGAVAARFGYLWLDRMATMSTALAQGESSLRRPLRGLVELRRALPVPVIVGIVVLAMTSFDLILPRAFPLVPAFLTAAVIYGLSIAVMNAVFAPGRPDDRLISVSDDMAASICSVQRQVGLAVAVGIIMLAYTRVLVTPIALTGAVTILVSLSLALIAIYWLRSTAVEVDRTGFQSNPNAAVSFVRPLLWLVVAAVMVSLAMGYIAFAAFFASRIAATLLIVAFTLLVIRLFDALIAEFFGADTHRGRHLAGTLGLRPERVELLGAVLGGILRVITLFFSIVLILSPWELQATDIGSTPFDDLLWGMKITDLRVSALAVVGALVSVIIGGLLLKTIKSWFDSKVLPRTGFDAGLQNSVSTIFGYIGIVVIGGIGLRQLGLDLSNLAIVAGALSVGIGFGLQSIVSNFVSGLILLAERPIRVGDSIVVKGEEGIVKGISVRSTEIETFEKATVIVPNAELISGVVKNWTHSNTWGRVIIHVRVAYDSDETLVRRELLAAAADQTHLLKDPPPRVFLLGFGDNGLEFQLRSICSDVQYSLAVRSDLHFAILERFRKANIIISPPIQRVQIPENPLEAQGLDGQGLPRQA